MWQLIKGLAIVLGLAEPRPGSLAIRRTLNAADGLAPWYGPTGPGEFTGEQLALTPAVLAQLEVHHDDYQRPGRFPRTWTTAAALASWRRHMDAWLDAEWLAWRDLLATYPPPGEAS